MTVVTSRITLVFSGLLATVCMFTAAEAQQRRRGYSYQTGKELYEHICQGCHMADAKGATGAGGYPALASNERLKASGYPILLILRGQKAMPAFSDLSDEQVSSVTNYIRSNFGNGPQDQVTPGEVKKLRSYAIEGQAQRPG